MFHCTEAVFDIQCTNLVVICGFQVDHYRILPNEPPVLPHGQTALSH